MAVIQISKIQVRRGLQENLPQLASGEMGWSVDTQRLYIGNGTLTEGAPEEGNTEIVTAGRDILSVIRSYIFKGTESGYTSITGPSVLDPVKRTFQEKLDDQVSARDFGAVGNGLDDDTVALQRAIDQVFPKDYYITVGVRRKLHIPAGTYIVSGNLRLPPYASIEGDGPRSTIIKQTSGSDTLLQLKDSKGNVGASINTVTSDAPFQITVKDLTFQTTEANDLSELNSCQIVTFNRVRFQGPVTAPTTSGDAKSAVKIVHSATSSQNIVFDRCEFARVAYGINLIGNVRAVTVNDSLFDTLYRGIVSSASVGSPQGVKVTASIFDNIAREAVYSQDDSGITSAFNFYANVGSTDGITNVVTGNVAYAALAWNTPNNYSIGDVFTRTTSQQLQYSLTEILNQDQTPSLIQSITAGSLTDSPGYSITLTDATTANTWLTLSSTVSSAIIDYKIQRGVYSRIGTIKVSHTDGTSVIYEDDYTENSALGITLIFVGNTTVESAVLRYTTTSTGNDAFMKYSIRSFV